MKDRFKFKGYWYNDCLKEWRVYDNPQFITGDGTAEIWYNTEGGAQPELPVNAELHLCQCTGLKDKNGKLIYEWDICEYEFEDIGKQKAIIYFNNKYASFLKKPLNDFQYAEINDCKVIGNIYENPELLEDTECQK